MTHTTPTAATRTVDGWTTAESEERLRLLLRKPPRPYGLFARLIEEAKLRKTWRYWGVGAVLIALGADVLVEHRSTPAEPVAILGWFIVAIGLFVLTTWAQLASEAARLVRSAPLGVGVIEKLSPLPGSPNLSWADAKTDDGTFVGVSVPTAVVTALWGEAGRCEVLFLRGRRDRTTGAPTGVGIAARKVVVIEEPPAEVAPAAPVSKPSAHSIRTERPGGDGHFMP